MSVCFQPIISDGFWVLSKPPVVGDMTIKNIETNATSTNLHVVFQSFEHEYINHDKQLELMEYYEWTVAEDGEDSAVLSEWKRIEDVLIIGETVCIFNRCVDKHVFTETFPDLMFANKLSCGILKLP